MKQLKQLGHFFPAIISISLYAITAMLIHLHSSLSSINQLSAFILAQAISAVFIGHISDWYCRKQTLIITQIIGIVLLLFVMKYDFNFTILFLIGLAYSPIPVSRAALVDNYPTFSKIKIIAISLLAQFLPWAFFIFVAKVEFQTLLTAVICLLTTNILITIFLFSDKRDLKKNNHQNKVFKREDLIKVIFILIGALLAQSVYFLNFEYIQMVPLHNHLFSALLIGASIGAIISIFYRKTPHGMVVTLTYGIGFMLAFIPLISNLLYPDFDFNGPFQMVLIGTLGGFYLPFIYDLILNRAEISKRGMMCGLVESVQELAGLLGILVNSFFILNNNILLAITAALFVLAITFQKLSEDRVN